MRIGIDARYWGTRDTGIGRYVQNLVLQLAKIDKENDYIIFGKEIIKEEIEKYPNFKWVKLTTRPYSLTEQIVNLGIFLKEKLDLLHVPHFNAPLLYPRPLVITLHDLIKHLSVGRATTTLPFYQYWLKHLLYRLVVRVNLARASAILTPAFFWKDYLSQHFGIAPAKIFVTYEAAVKTIVAGSKQTPADILHRYGLSKPFVIYTGNLYPHKNVPFLVEAVKRFNLSHEHKLQLALACGRDDTFKKIITPDETVKYLGFVTDADLALLYSQALALVQPSLIEGFGLVGLEAMSVGLPVLASQATVLPEIYGDAALYFDPRNEDQLVEALARLISDQELVIALIAAGRKRVKQFSWAKCARQTLAVYKQ
ncbi:MAG: glycosyltransferase family 1 protein [Patescibacteria group bacterium]